ncbi:MAG: hypothetical protein ACLQF1_15510 [Methyloceanibacter sp.]
MADVLKMLVIDDLLVGDLLGDLSTSPFGNAQSLILIAVPDPD